ncbi:RAN GTPase-activating protein 1 [Diplonema papillatum]|nr:RAN GTPase-activating protein 1 [Diplonema papillatum]
MPSKKKEANKLHAIRAHEKQFNGGVQGVTSYFTPSLVEICAKVVAASFPDQPRIESVLRSRVPENDGYAGGGTSPDDKPGEPQQRAGEGLQSSGEQLLQLVTLQLSTDLPLDVCVRRVSSEEYWKARCEARWPPQSGQLPAFTKYRRNKPGAAGSPSDTTGSSTRKPEVDWKRTYLERHLEEFAMALADGEPGNELADVGQSHLEELVELSKLTPDSLRGMHPTEIFENLCKLAADKVLELDLDRQRAHLDWSAVFSLLPKLEKFRVTFGVLDVGMNFRMKMVGIRKSDIVGFDHDRDQPPRGLVSVLRDPTFNVRHLSLPENQIDDERLRGLLLGLIQNNTVETLNLSHNKISDDGAKAIATLLMKKSSDGRAGLKVQHLDLGDNLLGVGAGRALGKALTVNTALRWLSLKLNSMTDEGGCPVILGIRQNASLTHLDLSNNELSLKCSEALAEVLPSNATLTELLLTGNTIGEEGGARLVDATRLNSSLTLLDVRAAGVSRDAAAAIGALLKERVDQQKSVDAVEREKVLRDDVSAAANDWRDRFYLGE